MSITKTNLLKLFLLLLLNNCVSYSVTFENIKTSVNNSFKTVKQKAHDTISWAKDNKIKTIAALAIISGLALYVYKLKVIEKNLDLEIKIKKGDTSILRQKLEALENSLKDEFIKIGPFKIIKKDDIKSLDAVSENLDALEVELSRRGRTHTYAYVSFDVHEPHPNYNDVADCIAMLRYWNDLILRNNSLAQRFEQLKNK